MHVRSCCFANQTNCFFDVLVVVRVVGLSDRVRATMQHLLWEGWYYCFDVNRHWGRVRCVNFDQKTIGDRATVHTVCCPNWWGRTRIFRLRKRKNLASDMQLNRRYSWRYGKVKFMCAIYFFYYYFFQNSGAPNDNFPLNALKTLLRLSWVL